VNPRENRNNTITSSCQLDGFNKALIEKCIEYNKLLVLIFVDYEKAFDMVNQQQMLYALAECRSIDYRYVNIIENVYENAKACIKLHDYMEDFPIEEGVRQGDVISPKLFTNLLEYMFKKIDFEDIGLNTNGERLNHLKFADDIVLVTDRIDEAREILRRLNNAWETAGLKINFSNTQFMTNLEVSERIYLGSSHIEQVVSYKHLGHAILIGRDNQTREIARRIGLSWAAFGKLSNTLKSDISTSVCFLC